MLKTAKNLSTSTLLKTGGGRLARVSVLVAGTAPGAAHDTDDTTKVAAGNKVYVIPNTVGMFEVEFPCQGGIVIVPGTGQTVAVSYN